MFEEGPVRRFIKEWKPIIPRKKLLGEIIVAGTPVDAEIERMLEEKKAEWRRRGYPENFIKMAGELASEWVASISSAFAPPELREALVRYNMRKGLEVADHWITTMSVPTTR
jgi:hypothetical protein